MLLIAEMVSS